MPFGSGVSLLIVPPGFLAILPAGPMFETIADKTDALLKALESSRDRRQMLHEVAAD
jgi:hypothetical protein